MPLAYTGYDWAVLALYVGLLALAACARLCCSRSLQQGVRVRGMQLAL